MAFARSRNMTATAAILPASDTTNNKDFLYERPRGSAQSTERGNVRIVITGMSGSAPAVLENMSAVILAADDGSADGAAPLIAHGSPQRIAQLAAVVLISIRQKLGAKAFERVVRAAREATGTMEDVSSKFIEPREGK